MRARVQRLDRLERKLKAMPRAVGEAMRVAYEQNGDELVAMMKRLAPRDQGDLIDSIEWKYGDNEDSRVGVKGRFGLAIVVSAGTDNEGAANHARYVEFGTPETFAQPFFFPSYRALRKRMKSRITRAQNKAIKEIAAR